MAKGYKTRRELIRALTQQTITMSTQSVPLDLSLGDLSGITDSVFGRLAGKGVYTGSGSLKIARSTDLRENTRG